MADSFHSSQDPNMRKAFLVAGLGFGDEGKGATVDFLVREQGAGLVVRYNGGAQAAHNVVTEDGREHTFSQFGSGTFVPDVLTLLSHYVIINPISMIQEAEHLAELGVTDAFSRTFISQDCVIVTPYQRALNRLTEISRGDARHGSCGMGIGQARKDHLELGNQVLFAGDIQRDGLASSHGRKKLEFLRQRCLKEAWDMERLLPDSNQVFEEWNLLHDADSVERIWRRYMHWSNVSRITSDEAGIIQGQSCVVFEGAQGILLDEMYGTAPHNTWTNTTFSNAFSLLISAEHSDPAKRQWWDLVKIGCLRSYHTRHGQGPFPTEEPELLRLLPEPHNDSGNFQGGFRVGRFDYVLAAQALKIIGGVDYIAMSHMDRLPVWNSVVSEEQFIDFVEHNLGTPINILGYGPRACDRRRREQSKLDTQLWSPDLLARVPCSNDEPVTFKQPV
jgi:adenylosuccinate synthase